MTFSHNNIPFINWNCQLRSTITNHLTNGWLQVMTGVWFEL